MEPKPKKSRRKPVLEPIRLDEILTGPGMSGFLSVLEPPVTAPYLQKLVNEIKDIPLKELTEERAQAPAGPEPTPVDSGALETPRLETTPLQPSALEHFVSPVESGGVDSIPLEPIRPESSPPQSSASEPSTDDWTGVYPPIDSTLGARRVKIREAFTAGDGHSLGEQALYETLYRASHPYSEQARIITLGLDRMAEMARLAYRNCKLNCRALIEKLALEEVRTYSYTRGRTYLVYHPEEIVRRRRTAGLTHVIKTRGVVFVDPATGEELTLKWHKKSTPLQSTPLESQ